MKVVVAVVLLVGVCSFGGGWYVSKVSIKQAIAVSQSEANTANNQLQVVVKKGASDKEKIALYEKYIARMMGFADNTEDIYERFAEFADKAQEQHEKMYQYEPAPPMDKIVNEYGY
jgi:arginyl-tRNA--protein-N-Asp/Glu arginylyltransferase